MATTITYRLRLSDGATTVDLFQGAGHAAMEAGLSMPPPNVQRSLIGSFARDGDRLAARTARHRIITLTNKVWGADKADLKTRIREIEELLELVRYRNLHGFGDPVYFEYQWGDTADQSTLFDVLDGEHRMPGDILSTHLDENNLVLNSQLRLICKPYGRRADTAIGQATPDNSQGKRLIKESFTTDNSTQAMEGADWEAQTFTTTSAFTAKGAAIKIAFTAGGVTGGTLTLSIRATVGGLPVGPDLASGTFDASGIIGVGGGGTNDGVGWAIVDFAVPVALLNATEYALVARTDATAPDGLEWWVDTTAGYAAGQRAFSVNAGGAWTADATDDLVFAVYATDTKINYQDVATSESFGDVEALAYIKAGQSGATGTRKVWFAKRTGGRQTDLLWFDGEDITSGTNIVGGAHRVAVVGDAFPSISESGDFYQQAWARPTGGAIAANTEVARLNYLIPSASLPRGQFRVLVRVRVQADDAADFDHCSWGLGYSYGNTTKAPSEASSEYFQVAAHNTWGILDLGVVDIPPVPESSTAGNNDFELRIYQYATDTLAQDEDYFWQTSFIFLLPIDEGYVIADAIVSTDAVALDGIADDRNVFTVDGAEDITGLPTYVGSPPSIGRDDTRFYFLRDDDDSMSWISDITYRPQQLVI